MDMKVDKVSEDDKVFIDYFKKTFGLDTKIFKFKKTKNAGANKSQVLEVFNYVKKRMKQKENFKIVYMNLTYNHIYNRETDKYTVSRSNGMSERDRRIWLG